MEYSVAVACSLCLVGGRRNLGFFECICKFVKEELESVLGGSWVVRRRSQSS